jgi:3-deoxy-7-phosphoheptulonate synthase
MKCNRHIFKVIIMRKTSRNGKGIEKSSILHRDSSESYARVGEFIPYGELRDEIQLTEKVQSVVSRGREEVRKVLRGEDKRAIMIIGPHTIHNAEAAKEYANLLISLKEKVKNTFVVVMNACIENPRFDGNGWKGYVYDSRLSGNNDLNTGLRLSRKLLLDISELGLPLATQFVDPIISGYISDFIAWGSVSTAGSYYTDAQIEMASAAPMPIGFENAANGEVIETIEAMSKATQSLTFSCFDLNGKIAEAKSLGNDDVHLILRGGATESVEKGGLVKIAYLPNYDGKNISLAKAVLRGKGLPERLIVDCGQAIAGLDHKKIPEVVASVIQEMAQGNDSIKGVVIPSDLKEGRQFI